MADKDDLQKDLDNLFGKLEGNGEKDEELVELPPAADAPAEQASVAPPAPPKAPAPTPMRRGLPTGMSSEEADALIAKILGGPPKEEAAAEEAAEPAAAESGAEGLGDILAGLDAEPVEVGAAAPEAAEAPREEPAEVVSQAAAAEEPEAVAEVAAEEPVAPAAEAVEPVEVASKEPEPEPVAAFSAAETERPSREPDDAVSAFFNRLKRESDLASEAPTPIATPAVAEETVEAAPSREEAESPAAFLSADELEEPAEAPEPVSAFAPSAEVAAPARPRRRAEARSSPARQPVALDEISRPWRAVALAAWAFMIWMLSAAPAASFPGIGIPHIDVAAHLVIFGVLAALLARFACGERPESTVRAIVALSIIVATAYGVVDELHQRGVEGREFSYGDMLTDAVGAAIGALAWVKVPDPGEAGTGPASAASG